MWGRIISTHALTEGDLEFFGLLKGDDISTHALTEGDHQPAATGSPVSYFNSRPHGGRLRMFNSVSLTLYFNSRPHGGRHSHGAGIGSSFCISTHALTEGDVDKVPIIPTPSISTHALTEGDSFQKPPEALKRSFQLTPSRRATANLDKFFF